MILVADDDALVLATLSAGLRSAGYQVLEAADGDEAIQQCQERSPDLAILDIQMPGKTGIEVAQQLYDSTGTPFIFLSAFDDQAFVDEGVEKGALGYLVKPVDVHQIVPTIEAALSRARQIRGLQERESHLTTALSGGRETSTAIGLIMAETGMGARAAEDALRAYARSHRMRMHEVAQQLIETQEQFSRLVNAIRDSVDQ